MDYLETFISRLIIELGNQLNNIHAIREQSFFGKLFLGLGYLVLFSNLRQMGNL